VNATLPPRQDVEEEIARLYASRILATSAAIAEHLCKQYLGFNKVFAIAFGANIATVARSWVNRRVAATAERLLSRSGAKGSAVRCRRLFVDCPSSLRAERCPVALL
jgi:hypothetical protein